MGLIGLSSPLTRRVKRRRSSHVALRLAQLAAPDEAAHCPQTSV
jgi:hypothetical protein